VKLRMSLPCAFLCLAMILISAQVGLAQALQPIQPQEPAWLTQMYAEGWHKVQEGVLQRNSEEGTLETFTYGEEGLRYGIGRLKERVNFLQQLYSQHPSTELGEAIDRVQNQIAVANANLQFGQVEAPSNEQMQNCDIAYGAHAYAGALTSSQGVTASSDAYFHNNCGIVGNAYAQVYLQAQTGTVFSTKTQEDAKYGGTWLDSAAQWSLSGTTNCAANSYAHAWSDSPYLSYDTSAQTNGCPPTPVQVYISGTADLYTDNYSPCQNATWTASVSGGTPGYAIYWYIGGVYQASGSQFAKQYCYTNTTETVTAVAYDSSSPQQYGQASYATNVYYSTYYNPCSDNPYSCQCDSNYCCGSRIRQYEECPYLYPQN
jgi:hypothetical protein